MAETDHRKKRSRLDLSERDRHPLDNLQPNCRSANREWDVMEPQDRLRETFFARAAALSKVPISRLKRAARNS